MASHQRCGLHGAMETFGSSPGELLDIDSYPVVCEFPGFTQGLHTDVCL